MADNAIKNNGNSSLKRKCVSMSEEFNNFDPDAQRPLKRWASVANVSTSGFCFNPGRPTGSDMRDSSLSGHPIAMDIPEPVTSLSLSLPGFDPVTESMRPEPSTVAGASEKQREFLWAVREIVRREVRKYVAEMEQSEAIRRNALVKRINGYNQID